VTIRTPRLRKSQGKCAQIQLPIPYFCSNVIEMNTLLALFKETFRSWSAHNAQKMGAALAYYTVFSLAPLLVLVVGVVGLLVGQEETVRIRIHDQAADLMGEAGVLTVDAILSHSAQQESGLRATMIGFIVVLVGASGVFTELQDSLNSIWEVPAGKRRWRLLLRKRLLSFGMVFALGFLVLVSLLLSAGIVALRTYVTAWVPGWESVWENTSLLITFAIVTLLFAAIFRYLPDEHVDWRDVWTGSALTGLLFMLGKFLLGVYISRSAFASAYGAAGSLLVVLVWVFYSAQIFFLGAEFTRAVARRRGNPAAARLTMKANH
jgi:membrane protein